jgi:lysophospholipase L1-like esterase
MPRTIVLLGIVLVALVTVVGVIADQVTSPDGQAVAVLGDSITVLGQTQLNSSLGHDFKLSANGLTGAEISQRLPEATTLAAGKPTQVIINLGTNDALQHVPIAQSTAALQQMLALFHPAKCIHLVTINTHMDPPNGDVTRPWALALNKLIRKEATTNSNVDVIDWDGINAGAVTKSHPAGLTFDGVHPTPAAERQLVSAYSDALEHCGRPWRIW